MPISTPMFLAGLPGFSWYNIPKRGKRKCTKWPQCRPNGSKIDTMAIQYMYQHHPLQELSKFTQNGIFGFKICHLATLVPRNHHWQKQKNKKEKNSGSGVHRRRTLGRVHRHQAADGSATAGKPRPGSL
jgi:hypothetical protein